MSIRLTIVLSLVAATLLCWFALYTAQSIARAQVRKIQSVEETQ